MVDLVVGFERMEILVKISMFTKTTLSIKFIEVVKSFTT